MAIIRTDITSDAQWHELRKRNIGASEIGALFNHDYATPYSLSAQKLGKLERAPDNEAMKRGRLLEPVALALLQEAFPQWFFEKPKAYFEDTDARLGATPDLFVYREEDEPNSFGTIQVKTVEPSVFLGKWHDADDELRVPTWINLQVHQEAHLCGASYAFVAAVIGFNLRLELIEVPLDPKVIERIYQRAEIFWHQVDAGKTLDPDFGRDAKAISAVLKYDDDSEVDMRDDNMLPTLASRLESAQAARKMADDMCTEVRGQILHRIGNAARVKYAGGIITAETTHRKEYTVAASSFRRVSVKPAIKNRQPDLAEATKEIL